MPPAIVLRSLSKRFGSVVAVDDLDLEVEAGAVFGFLGPNGAGKTTTIRMMMGFITPTAGSVRLLGREISRDPGDVLARIGSLPGEFGLWHGLNGQEVLDYLADLCPRPAADQRSLIDLFELSQRDLARPVRSYSRGMRQKLGIIQAFQHRPDLVVLDEPTEGLDPLMQDLFLDLLRSFASAGGTVFMSSHILSEIEAIADLVGVIRQGRLVKLGSPIDLAGEHIHIARLVLRDPSADLTRLRAVEGLDAFSLDGPLLRFQIRGPIAPALQAIAELDLLSCTIEPPKLSNAFIDLYRGEG
ncbi:MAG: ABC transporter ATP-binding protein [Actinomycetota bacterium]